MLRIVTTNDFAASLDPLPTSYGHLPGGVGLRQTVERLRNEQPTLWIDVGDFAQGLVSALAGSDIGFAACNELGIDLAAAGNHEFDWGVDHLRSWAGRLNFPLLCANLDIGLPAAAIRAVGGVTVGVIGLTNPDGARMSLYLPDSDPDLAGIVHDQCLELRRQGADVIIAALHEGADWSLGAQRQFVLNTDKVIQLCNAWAHEVDAILLGHTLGRWLDQIGGTPVVQPWAFGAELGVIELEPRNRSAARSYGITPDTGPFWTGAGAAVLRQAHSETLGQIAAPLSTHANGPSSLCDFLAQALRFAVGCDVAIVPTWNVGGTQPPLDGVISHIPAGRFTRASLHQIIPWTDDSTVTAEFSPPEVRRIINRVSPFRFWTYSGSSGMPGWEHKDAVTVAINRFEAQFIAASIGRSPEWRAAGCGLRQAVVDFLRDQQPG